MGTIMCAIPRLRKKLHARHALLVARGVAIEGVVRKVQGVYHTSYQGLEKYYRRAWISVLRLSGKYLVYHIKPLISQLVIRYSEVHVVGIKYIALYS